MLETKHDDDAQKDIGENQAKGQFSSTQMKKGQGSPTLQSKKSKSKYALTSVPLDDGEKSHAPIDSKGAIAFVGISVGSPDFEGDEFWELCRSIVEAGYDEIVFVVGGVLQRHNVFVAHAHKKAIKEEEVTKEMMDSYEANKKQKKWQKALNAENVWIEKHSKYIDKLKTFGKTVTLIPWIEILENKHGDFKKHLNVITHEYLNGKNGIKTYVGKAANGMYEIRSKQTTSMTTHQKELYDSATVELEQYFKGKNVEYFKEETAAFRMLKVDKFPGRKLHYIYPNKGHDVGLFFLKAVRRALELVSEIEKKLMEFYAPVPRNRAKKDDTNQRLYSDMQKLNNTNVTLLSEIEELRGQLAFIKEEVSPKSEAILRLQEQVQVKQARLEKVGALVRELETALVRLPNLSLATRNQMVQEYTLQLVQLAAEAEQEQQESEYSDDNSDSSHSNKKSVPVPHPSGRNQNSRGSSSGSSNEGTPRGASPPSPTGSHGSSPASTVSSVPAVIAPSSSFHVRATQQQVRAFNTKISGVQPAEQEKSTQAISTLPRKDSK